MTENSSRTETDPDTSTCTITVRDKPYRIDLAVPNIAKRRLAEALRTEYREYHGIPQASISVGWQHDFGLPPTGTHVSLRQPARIVVERILPKPAPERRGHCCGNSPPPTNPTANRSICVEGCFLSASRTV